MKEKLNKVKETLYENRTRIAFAAIMAGACGLCAHYGYKKGINSCAKFMNEKFSPLVNPQDLDILSVGVKRGADYVTSAAFESTDMVPLKELVNDVTKYAEVISEDTPVMAYTILFKRES